MEKFQLSPRLDWLNALRVCLGFGGTLVTIENEKEMEVVGNMSSKLTNDDRAWIGLVYWFKKGGYTWDDGTPYNSSIGVNWLDQRGWPCNNSEIRCVEISRNGWNLTECCKQNRQYICKRPKGGLMLKEYRKIRVIYD